MFVPSLLLVLVLNYIPIVQSFVLSFYDWSGGARRVFLGFGNYVELFQDEVFLESLFNQGVILLVRTILMIVPPLVAAELIFGLRNRDGVANFYRMLFVIPIIVPPVVVLLIWRFIYDGQVGLLNAILDSIGLEQLSRGWLSDPDTALGAVIAIGFPWVEGTNMLIFLAGLLAVDDGIWDSLKLEGVRPLERFFRIDFYLIGGQLSLISILTLIRLMQDFVGIIILTNGGPGSRTLVPGLYLYKSAFSFGKMGYANAIGVVMFIVLMGLSVLNLRLRARMQE